MKSFKLGIALPAAALAIAAVGSAFTNPVKHAFNGTTFFTQTIGGIQTLVANQTIPTTNWNSTLVEPTASTECQSTLHTCFVAAKIVGVKKEVNGSLIQKGVFIGE